jgi:predicted flap endonuclease-1-like 5' DNA nuclease
MEEDEVREEVVTAEPEPEQAEAEPEQVEAAEPGDAVEETVEQAAAEPEPAAGENAEKPVVTDDLTYIQGIGSGRLKQLNEAGIYTFEQLANSSPEDIKKALGDSSRLVDVNKWIAQAKDFA